MRNKTKAAVTLLFLSPIIAEMLSGSTPPLEFLNPIALALLLGLYGTSVLLIREFKVRYNLGYASVLMLGFAYGVLEEGIATKSFFDPYWPDCSDFLCQFGRFAGVNWVWSIGLTIYHGLWSILVPIIIVEILFHEVSEETWFSRKTIVILTIILITDVVLIHMFISRFYIGAIELSASILTILIISLYALLSDRKFSKKQITSKKMFLKALLISSAFFMVFYAISYVLKMPLLTITLELIIAHQIYTTTKQLDYICTTYECKAAFASSPILVLSTLAILQGFSGKSDMLFAAALGLLLIILVKSKTRIL